MLVKALAAFILAFVVVSAGALSPLKSATIYVPDDWPTIQGAIDAAVERDTIIVRSGTYRGFGNKRIDFKGKAVTVRSEDGPGTTIIDCEQSGIGFVFQRGETRGARLDSITILNGRSPTGGGIRISGASPTISRCIIRDCRSGLDGGGIRCVHKAAPRIQRCIIEGNRAEGAGGGIYCASDSAPLITGCTVRNNISLEPGGGIHCRGCRKVLIGCSTISGNSSEERGGGIAMIETDGIIQRCFIKANRAAKGGGVVFKKSKSTVTSSVLAGNSATVRGGGLLGLSSDLILTCLTLVDNITDYGGGLCGIDSSVRVGNTILSHNTALEGQAIWLGRKTAPSTLTISYSDLHGGNSTVHAGPGSSVLWGQGLIDSDPLFVDPLIGDYHLTHPSPCKDAGQNMAPGLNTDARDVEGDPRKAEGRVDLGADEFHPHLYWSGEPRAGKQVYARVIGYPGQVCTICIGTGLQPAPMHTPYGPLYLDWPIRLRHPGTIPADGVIIFPYIAPAWIWPGKTFFFQALTGAKLTNLLIIEAE